MKIYIDSEYRCSANPGEGLTAVETDFFDGKCAAYIAGYCYVPAGETWALEDGVGFDGEMITPWKPWEILDATQREYEQERMAELASQNAELLSIIGEMVEDVYQSDLGVMEENTDV